MQQYEINVRLFKGEPNNHYNYCKVKEYFTQENNRQDSFIELIKLIGKRIDMLPFTDRILSVMLNPNDPVSTQGAFIQTDVVASQIQDWIKVKARDSKESTEKIKEKAEHLNETIKSVRKFLNLEEEETLRISELVKQKNVLEHLMQTAIEKRCPHPLSHDANNFSTHMNEVVEYYRKLSNASQRDWDDLTAFFYKPYQSFTDHRQNLRRVAQDHESRAREYMALCQNEPNLKNKHELAKLTERFERLVAIQSILEKCYLHAWSTSCSLQIKAWNDNRELGANDFDDWLIDVVIGVVEILDKSQFIRDIRNLIDILDKINQDVSGAFTMLEHESEKIQDTNDKKEKQHVTLMAKNAFKPTGDRILSPILHILKLDVFTLEIPDLLKKDERFAQLNDDLARLEKKAQNLFAQIKKICDKQSVDEIIQKLLDEVDFNDEWVISNVISSEIKVPPYGENQRHQTVLIKRLIDTLKQVGMENPDFYMSLWQQTIYMDFVMVEAVLSIRDENIPGIRGCLNQLENHCTALAYRLIDENQAKDHLDGGSLPRPPSLDRFQESLPKFFTLQQKKAEKLLRHADRNQIINQDLLTTKANTLIDEALHPDTVMKNSRNCDSPLEKVQLTEELMGIIAHRIQSNTFHPNSDSPMIFLQNKIKDELSYKTGCKISLLDNEALHYERYKRYLHSNPEVLKQDVKALNGSARRYRDYSLWMIPTNCILIQNAFHYDTVKGDFTLRVEHQWLKKLGEMFLVNVKKILTEDEKNQQNHGQMNGKILRKPLLERHPDVVFLYQLINIYKQVNLVAKQHASLTERAESKDDFTKQYQAKTLRDAEIYVKELEKLNEFIDDTLNYVSKCNFGLEEKALKNLANDLKKLGAPLKKFTTNFSIHKNFIGANAGKINQYVDAKGQVKSPDGMK